MNFGSIIYKERLQREEEERISRINREKAEIERIRMLKEKEEWERMRKLKEKEEEEAERLRILQEKRQYEEWERMRKLKEEEEAERLRILQEKREYEERLKRQREEEERFRLLREKEEFERLRLLKEKEEFERLQRLKEEDDMRRKKESKEIETMAYGDYIILRSTNTVNLKGWYLRCYVPDKGLNFLYKFTHDVSIKKGDKLRIWSKNSVHKLVSNIEFLDTIADNIENWSVHNRYSVTKLVNLESFGQENLTHSQLRLSTISSNSYPYYIN